MNKRILNRGSSLFLQASQRVPSVSARNFSAGGDGKSIVLKDQSLPVKSPWQEVKDPKGTALTYYWNPQSNQTTALGAPRPQYWVEVEDPKGSHLTYWNPETNQTTALGVPMPSELSIPYQPLPPPFAVPPTRTLGGAMKLYFGLGVGMTLGMIAIRALLG
jgi:hypothetical protein